MDELISKIDVNAIERAINKGIEYGGGFFLRFQSFAIVSNLVWIIISLILFILTFLFYKKLWNYLEGSGAEMFIVLVIMIHCLFLGILCKNIYNLIEAIYVPEVYLLQYITK